MANFNKLNLPPFSSRHTTYVSGDATNAVYIRNGQVKTCAIGVDLELHNSNDLYSNAPLFYTARIPFLKPTWVHKTGGNMHTLYMLEARAALRRHKTTKSNGIGMSKQPDFLMS